MTAPHEVPGPLDVDLTIRLTEAPGAAPYTFRLMARDGTPGPGSTLPDPSAALEAVRRFGEDLAVTGYLGLSEAGGDARGEGGPLRS